MNEVDGNIEIITKINCKEQFKDALKIAMATHLRKNLSSLPFIVHVKLKPLLQKCS